MVLDHERLDVYLVALDFVVFANEVIERLPRGRSHLADHRFDEVSVVLRRAASFSSWNEQRLDLAPLPIVELRSNHHPDGTHQ